MICKTLVRKSTCCFVRLFVCFYYHILGISDTDQGTAIIVFVRRSGSERIITGRLSESESQAETGPEAEVYGSVKFADAC